MNCFNIIWKWCSIIFRLHVLSLSSKVLRLKIQRLSDSPYVMVIYPDSISVLKWTWNCKLSKTVLLLRVERTVRCVKKFSSDPSSTKKSHDGVCPTLLWQKNLTPKVLTKNCMLVLCEKFIFYLDKNCNVGLFIRDEFKLNRENRIWLSDNNIEHLCEWYCHLSVGHFR